MGQASQVPAACAQPPDRCAGLFGTAGAEDLSTSSISSRDSQGLHESRPKVSSNVFHTCVDDTEEPSAIFRTTSEVVTEIAYGAHRDDNYDFIDLNDQLQEIIHKVLQGYIVDLIPWCTSCHAFAGARVQPDDGFSSEAPAVVASWCRVQA